MEVSIQESLVPRFTNQKLISIKQRSNNAGLLIDLVPVHSSFYDDNKITSKVEKGSCNYSSDWLKLSLMAANLMKTGKIDNLSTLDLLDGRLEPYPYQLKVALNVLREKSSIALLADEVGLGKTIEVGLILKEHIVRGNIHSILIITPKALVLQWKEELKEKFDEEFITTEDDNFDYSSNRIITSFNKLSRNVEKFTNRQWDMVVVDEAHLLINANSKRRKAVSAIDRRYMLLCTATPLCNKLTDIYSLVDLLYPGILGTEKSFKSKYFYDRYGRICRPEMKDELKKIISKVMVRTLRKDSGIPFTERFVYSHRINCSKEELLLYDTVIKYMRKIYENSVDKNNDNNNNSSQTGRMQLVDKILNFDKSQLNANIDLKIQKSLSLNNDRKLSLPSSLPKRKVNYLLMKELITIQQSLSSSPRALIKSLENRKLKNPEEAYLIDPIIELASEIGTYSKVQKLLETVSSLSHQQGIIFTLRLETAYLLCDSLNENYIKARVYEGRLSGFERQSLIDEFRRGKIQYIVATDAAAEGLNLQNASIVINYDLHWNPMKIEQRIGRVHRRGQNKDVTIFNLVMKDTIDDYVLKVLFEKIDLFKMTIGGIETILSEIRDGDFSIEETIMEIIMRSSRRRDIEKELDELRQSMDYIKEQNALREEFSKSILD
ncbi:MAG TPA: DEAD/DEAH box helicase [Clostridiaceae bacterium]|nr:DEAD/DEAH box helicase [Clostridiaceae bacterium]